MICVKCNTIIPPDREEFILLTNKPSFCIQCSTEQAICGLMDYGHKTAPQLVILPNNKAIQRIAKRAFRRAR